MISVSVIETMARAIHLVLLCLMLKSELIHTKKCNRSQGTAIKWETQLHTDLKRDYDISEPPPANKSQLIDVRVRFILKSFEFISREEVLSLYTWMFISWIDDRLKWDPAKYNGTKITKISNLRVWTPWFRLFNAADPRDEEVFFYLKCNLNYMGSVLCVPRSTHQTSCSVKLSNWPYDRQKCSVIYGPFHTNDCFKMSFTDRAVKMLGAEYGAEWMIVDYEQIENQNSDKQLELVFTIEREAATLAALIIYPSYILIALTLGTLWLDVRNDLRLYLVCFSFLCHYYFICQLGEHIPKESIDPPTIVLFYRGLEILIVIEFLLTMCLKVLCKRMSRPIKVITAINDASYNSVARFLIHPRWESEREWIEGLGEDDFSTDWTKFANIINSLTIIIFVIVYICLYIAFMPQPHPFIN